MLCDGGKLLHCEPERAQTETCHVFIFHDSARWNSCVGHVAVNVGSASREVSNEVFSRRPMRHPVLCAVKTLCQSSSSKEESHLMHINPSMSGPVLFYNSSITVPYSVAFAGAEFIALGKTEIEGKEYWEVVVQVRL